MIIGFQCSHKAVLALLTGRSASQGATLQKNTDYNGFRGGPTKPCKGGIFVAAISDDHENKSARMRFSVYRIKRG
ncbi:Uncharacterized protein dnm_092680 [Desulfonema magnum]|uniref:Uncharacterized protein n=1 Tax=Desulfonema magnum TaxID=45655 RepID=A0A975BWS0_9BACT|nr:Uncharacterized protein dnm_092680 [Desulfonema magnum]